MILNVCFVETDEGLRYQVHAQDPDDPGNMRDVTDQYTVTATESECGLRGFAVLKRERPAEAASDDDSLGEPAIADEASRGLGGVEL